MADLSCSHFGQLATEKMIILAILQSSVSVSGFYPDMLYLRDHIAVPSFPCVFLRDVSILHLFGLALIMPPDIVLVFTECLPSVVRSASLVPLISAPPIFAAAFTFINLVALGAGAVS